MGCRFHLLREVEVGRTVLALRRRHLSWGRRRGRPSRGSPNRRQQCSYRCQQLQAVGWSKKIITNLSGAQRRIHCVKTKRCEPAGIESTIALELIRRFKHGIMRAVEILVCPDKVSLKVVRPNFGLKAGDYPEVVAGTPHGPPEVGMGLWIDANFRSIG